ncbi:hypothetical protein EDB83DRAFT_2506475 [Lactarius deliciosus]|nr:hypothetical protein EDB83DRAFT_2506475 [Lactarius deliciosus]
MLAHAHSREDSPATTPNGPPTKKRKQNPPSHNSAADSPAPSDPSSLSNPTPTENVVLPAYLYDLSTRPRLTISRAPAFVPISEDSQYYNTDQLAHNRLGASTNPFRTIESAPQAYRVSWEDRSPFVKVTQDGLGLLGEKGFPQCALQRPCPRGALRAHTSALAGDGARHPSAGPAVLDGYSYGMRDKTGEKITLSRPRAYGEPFGAGDVVGMYISLPALREGAKRDPHDPAHVKRERIAIEFKGQEYFESLEYTQSKEMIALMDFSRKPNADTSAVPPPAKKSATVKNVPERGRGASSASEPAPMRPLPTLPDSKIAFFVNGRCQGVAFHELGAREHKENHFDDGSLGYFPLVSLFNGARVRLNPGPDFAFPPPSDIDCSSCGRCPRCR